MHELELQKQDTIEEKLDLLISDFKRASEMSYDECMKARKKKIKANHPMLSDKEIEKYAKDRCLILSRKK